MRGNHGSFRAGRTFSVPALPILDDLSISATGAYSLRKMRAAYAGSCIRVRRSSDNAEQDIGFVADILDTATLLSFVGVGNGFVTTWYDQSTAGLNATQTNAGFQPRVVTSGALILSNTKPTIQFTNSFFNLSGISPGNYSSFSVIDRASPAVPLTAFSRSDAQLPFTVAMNVDGFIYISNGAVYARYFGAALG